MKIVINKCFGGFGLSHKAVMQYAELKGFKLYPFVETGECHRFKPYGGGEVFLIHYSKAPLLDNGSYLEDSYFSDRDIERTDPILIKVVEELKEKANGHSAKLSVIEIPDDIKWEIDEYDGIETVHEKHGSWG